MKKTVSLLLAASLLLSLAGCGLLPQFPSFPTKGSQNGTEPTEPSSSEPPAQIYDDSLISDAISEEFSWADEYNCDWDCSFHIPQILSDAPGAESVNLQIANDFGGYVNEAKTAMRDNTSPGVITVSWDSYWTGSVLSLVLTAQYSFEFTDYMVYHYDFAADTTLQGWQVAELYGASYADLITALRRAAAQFFDRTTAPFLTPDASAGVAYLRSWTITDENLSCAMFYPDGGTIYAIVPVGSIAGANWYYHCLPLDLSEPQESGFPVESTCDFITAKLNFPGVGITFRKTETAEPYRQAFNFSYDEEYEVPGCYGNYTKILVESLGPSFFPIVFLCTDAGTVEFIDLLRGMSYGALRCGGPLFGLSNIVDLQGENGAAYAIDEQGVKYDLMEYLQQAENILPYSFTGRWESEAQYSSTSSGDKVKYQLILAEDGGLMLNENDPANGETYYAWEGAVNYLGMDGTGMVYGYVFNGDAVPSGAFAFGMDDGTLRVRQIAGGGVLDVPQGDYIDFLSLLN